jgi:amphiphysin
LPGFFYYNTKLMEPIFNTFYYLQLRIYNIMLERITPLANSGYYDLTMDVLQGYEARKRDTAPTVEPVDLITRKSVTASKSPT